ncbi:MAG: hypothetical protein ACXAB7_14830 [Candidatus Kariarchaeaceae archaeon]
MDIIHLQSISPSNIRRVAIWGAPSSGKTLLSQKISKVLGISTIIHTDDHLYTQDWKMRSKQELISRVRPLIKSDSWIVDGNLGEYIPRREILQSSNVVILLNPRISLLSSRIVRRELTVNTRLNLIAATPTKMKMQHLSQLEVLQSILTLIRIAFRFNQIFVHYLLHLSKQSETPVIVIKNKSELTELINFFSYRDAKQMGD